MTGWMFWIVVLIAVIGLGSSVPELYGRWKAQRDKEERERRERHEAKRQKRHKKHEKEKLAEWEAEDKVHWEDQDRY